MRLLSIFILLFSFNCVGQTEITKDIDIMEDLFSKKECLKIYHLETISDSDTKTLYYDTLEIRGHEYEAFKRLDVKRKTGVFTNKVRACKKMAVEDNFNYVHSKIKGLKDGDYHVRVYKKGEYEGSIYQLIVIMYIGLDSKGLYSPTSHILLRLNSKGEIENYMIYLSII